MGPSGRSELPVPRSTQKDTERGWTDPELQLNHLEEAAENLDPGPLPDLRAQHLQGLAFRHHLSRELPGGADACHGLWSWARPPAPHMLSDAWTPVEQRNLRSVNGGKSGLSPPGTGPSCSHP